MAEIFRKYKKWIIIIVVLILAFIVYSYFAGGKSSSNNVLTTTGGTDANGNSLLSGSSEVGQSFVNQLITLQSVSLNDAIFSDPRFQNLQDFSQPIPDEPQGRPNPFAPIGVDVSNGPTINNGGAGAPSFTIQSATTTKSSK